MEQAATYRRRADRLRKALGDAGLDGVLMAPGPNMRYFTGVTSAMHERPFVLFVTSDGSVRLVAPAIEAGPYRNCMLPMSIYAWTDSQGPSEAVAHAVRGLGKGRWGVEGRMPFQYLNALKSRMRMTPEDAEPILQGLRAVKDQDEVRLMKKSGEILSRSFDEAPNLIDLGMTELELARKLADLIIAKGASGVSDLLVQSGPRAANPHGLASKKRIKSGEPIILDLVSVYEGYYADITRTLCIGRSVEVERVYEQVLEAQSRARAAAGEGVAVGSVDRAARKYLVDHGLGKYFIHRTGHGLGLEVHEEPYIVDGGDALLRENMFFTIEPGVYIPGKIGVRIEDDVRVDGHRALETTNPPKQYGWWK